MSFDNFFERISDVAFPLRKTTSIGSPHVGSHNSPPAQQFILHHFVCASREEKKNCRRILQLCSVELHDEFLVEREFLRWSNGFDGLALERLVFERTHVGYDFHVEVSTTATRFLFFSLQVADSADFYFEFVCSR